MGPSAHDPSCIGCDAEDTTPDPARFDWVPGRGVVAADGFDPAGLARNVLTNFPFASSQEAYDRLYTNLFCLRTDDWSMFRGERTRRGQSAAWGPRDAAVVRSVPTGGDVVSSPILGPDGTVYVASADDRLYAFNADLTLRWNEPFETGQDVVASAAFADGAVYIGSEDGGLYRIDAATGAPVWEFGAGGEVMSSVAIDDDRTLYFLADGLFGTMRLHALRPDATEKWTSVEVEGSHGLGDALLSSPAVSDDGRVYFGVPDGDDFNLYAVDTATGAMLWQRGLGSTGGSFGGPPDIRATPAVAPNGTVYVGTLGDDATLFALAGETGETVWSVRIPCGTLEDCSLLASPAIGADGTLYFGSRSGDFFAVTPDGRIAWRFSVDGEIESSATIGADGLIYFGADDGFLYALRPQLGLAPEDRLVFRADLEGAVRSSPAISAAGVLYVGSDSNELWAIGPSFQSTLPQPGCGGRQDGEACDDGVPCTTNDACVVGLCTGEDACPDEQICKAETNSCQPPFRSFLATFGSDFGAFAPNMFGSDGDVASFDLDLFGQFGQRILGESLFFDGGEFTGSESIDALARLPNGWLVLSTTNNANLAGLNFTGAELVRWDPVAGTAGVHLETSSVLACVGLFCTLNVDGVHVLPNGDLLLSTSSSARVRATNQLIHPGSVMRFSAGVFSEEIDESRLNSRNVDGIAVNAVTGRFLISFTSDGNFGGGPRFEEEDVIELPYGPGQAFTAGYTIYFDASREMVDGSGNMRDFDVE